MQLILPVKADKQSTEDFCANDAIVTRLGKVATQTFWNSNVLNQEKMTKLTWILYKE